MIREGWPSFLALIAPDVAALLRRLLADPTPLCAAMARYPQTVLHGDPRCANIGIAPSPRPRVVLLDWHFVGPGVPAVDLAYYLASIRSRAPVPNEPIISWYRERLAQRLGSRFEEQWWLPQLELSLLGEVVREAGSLAGSPRITRSPPRANGRAKALVGGPSRPGRGHGGCRSGCCDAPRTFRQPR